MKKLQNVLRISLIYTMVIVSDFSAQTRAAETRTLIQGWESWAPFTYVDDNKTLTGLDIEIVHHIFSRAGYVIQYQEAPWARQLRWLEDGTIQITASAMKTPEREAYAYFSDPYYKESYLVFVRKGEASNYHLTSLQEMIGASFKLGVMRDSVYGEEFVRLMQDPAFSKQIEAVPTDEQNHKKLLAHRLDGFIQESSRMSTEGRRSGIFEQVEPLFVVEENELHFMLSKQATTPEIVNVFNSGLKQMREDGTYQSLFHKYLLDQFNMLTE